MSEKKKPTLYIVIIALCICLIASSCLTIHYKNIANTYKMRMSYSKEKYENEKEKNKELSDQITEMKTEEISEQQSLTEQEKEKRKTELIDSIKDQLKSELTSEEIIELMDDINNFDSTVLEKKYGLTKEKLEMIIQDVMSESMFEK